MQRMDRFCSAQIYSSDEAVRDASEYKDVVLCPKPRRLGQLIGNAYGIKPHRFRLSHQVDLNDSAAVGNEIFDLILTKDYYDGLDQQHPGSEISSSPPYFCGSPPSRSANPLVHDARFLEEKHNSTTPSTPPFLSPSSPLSPSAGARKGGCARPTTKFGPNPAVRIEGFESLNSDNRGCGIPAVA